MSEYDNLKQRVHQQDQRIEKQDLRIAEQGKEIIALKELVAGIVNRK